MTIKVRWGEYDDEAVTMAIMPPSLQELLNQFFNLEYLRPWCENPHLHTKRGNNILFPTYGPLPPPRINELVIPTGATRWSYTVLVCDTPRKDQIYAAAKENKNRVLVEFGAGRHWGGNAELGDNTGNTQPVRLSMAPLQPHPVTIPEIDEAKFDYYAYPETNEIYGLWLIPFVDSRYFWQFNDVDNITAVNFEDPLAVLQWAMDRLSTVFRIFFTDNSAINHLDPGYNDWIPQTVGNDYENAAVLLDSWAWHLGLQIVPDMHQAVTSTDPIMADDWIAAGTNLSEEMYQRNLSGELLDLMTGGTASTTAVGLPIRCYGGELDRNDPEFLPSEVFVSEDAAGSDWIRVVVNPTDEEIARTLRLRVAYTEPVDEELAQLLAADYFKRFSRSYNYTFAATQAWQPSIYDDYAVYTQTLNVNSDGTSTASAMTRVRSWQGNLLPVFRQAPGEFSTVIFRPFEVCPGIGFTCDCVVATVVTAGCGSNLSPGDEIQVWDITQDNFLMPPELLFNSIGFARYYKIQEPSGNRPPGLEGDCRWVVEKMACVEQPLEEEE